MAAIIFDVDGTIADSFDYVSEFLAKEAGLPPLTDEQKLQLRGMSMGGMVRVLGYHWWSVPGLFFRGQRRMRQAIKNLEPFPGMPELIRKLHAEGHQLFILSANSKRNITHFLRRHKLRKYFVEIDGGVGMFGKAPAMKELLKRQGLETDQAVYVGDERRDVEAASAIGLRSIAVTWGFADRENLVSLKPTAVADTPEELLKILEEI